MQASTANLAAIIELSKQGALVEARDMLAPYLEDHPGDIAAHKLCAEIHFKLGRRDDGFRCAMRAFELDQSDIDYGLDCAFNLVRAGRRNDALRVAQLIAELSPESPYHCDTLGTVLTHCEVPEKAIPHFKHACALISDSPQFLFNLASAQRMVGAVKEAEVSLDRALLLDPSDGAAHLARSALRRQTPEENHVKELTAALACAASANEKVSIGYALAKELEDLAQYPQSFAHLAAASRLHRSQSAYDAGRELGLLRALRQLDYGSLLQGGIESDPGAMRPIFVVGLPRSGTTLVERIIGSVPGVRSAGESNVLAAEVWRVATRDGRPADPQAALVGAVRKAAGEIGSNYVSSFAGRFESMMQSCVNLANLPPKNLKS